MKKKLDSRKRYTRMVLKNSLMKLLKHKKITSITIKEICEQAEINRSTFYSHYNDQYHLLQTIEDEIIDELQRSLNQYDYKKHKKMIEMTKYLLEYVVSKNEEFLILFSDHANKGFQQRLMETIQTIIIGSLEENPALSKYAESKYISLFIVSGSLHVIAQWLKDGMEESIEDMTRTIIEISNQGLLHFAAEK